MVETVSKPDTLDARQHKALVALIEGHTNAEAAEIAGVERRTVIRWKSSVPAFAAALAAAQEEAIEAAGARLSYLLRTSLDCIEAVLKDDAAPAAARLRAAEVVLTRVLDTAPKTPDETGNVDPRELIMGLLSAHPDLVREVVAEHDAA